MKEVHWSEHVTRCEAAARPYVIVTVLGARGSTPRDSGTKMVVEATEFSGTIGGGTLEYRALAEARRLLANPAAQQLLRNYPLGEKLGQCCGGSTSLLFECFAPVMPRVFLFGAGHVGRALAPLLATLPLRVEWIDDREAVLPRDLPAGVTANDDTDPVAVVRAAPAGSLFVVMTHNHPLDFAIAEAALARGDAAFVGVIGSESKARRFRLRLAHRGLAEERIASLHCPVGLRDVPGKKPAEIAVAVAAQLIAVYQAARPATAKPPGPSWKELQASLAQDRGHPTITADAPGDTPAPGHDSNSSGAARGQPR
jgi:xanthine dehydrogenase accessory factor